MLTVPGPLKSMQNNYPKPVTRAQQAIVGHMFGIQVAAIGCGASCRLGSTWPLLFGETAEILDTGA